MFFLGGRVLMVQRFICVGKIMHPMLYREIIVLGDRHSHNCACNRRMSDTGSLRR